jgi:hypothetical protein
MSETLPATRAPELDAIARLGTWLAASEVEHPDAKQEGAAAALRIYFARELGLSPLAASELSVIRGRLVVSAKLLRARAAQYGYRVIRASGDETSCTARLVERESGEVVGESTFTMEDARRAGLVKDRSGWKTHPARMLWARASKFVIDDYAPEASLGLVLEDEAAEITGEVVAEHDDDDEPEPKPSPEWEAFRRGEGPYPPSVGAEIKPDPPGPAPADEEQSQFTAPEGGRDG